MEREKLSGKVILETKGMDRTYVMVRMDVLESMLRRGAAGIGLREIHIVESGKWPL